MIELSVPVATAGLFAQDQTERQVTTLIIVLIVVALLLATLTAWFWHHTDPRRRAFREAEARREELDTEVTRRNEGSLAAQRDAEMREANASLLARERRAESARTDERAPQRRNGDAGGRAEQAIDQTDDGGLSADEWIRLTGPAPKRNPGAGA